MLAAYAKVYRTGLDDRWLFAAANPVVLAQLSAQLDFHFMNEGGSFTHNLRTVVLDPQRRLHRVFEGNQWKAEDLARALLEAATIQPSAPTSSQ